MKLRIGWMCIVLLLVACGGGGGSTSGSINVGNMPPQFTSPSAVSVTEDMAGVFYNATATDIDGNSIIFRIQGGDDAALFTMTTAGALGFVTPPDFEAPTDADHNNVYRVTLSATDGIATTLLNLLVTVTDRGSLAFRVRRVASAIPSPSFVAAVPDGSGRIYVVELAGRIRILNPATGAIAATPFLDLRGQLSTNGERGLLGFATAPNFMTSGQFYVFVTDPVGTIEVRRYNVMPSNRDVADPNSMRLILRQPHPRTNHNGGWIGFDKSGFLYIGIGDGGGNGDPDDNGQNRDTLLGKILRIDITRDQFGSDDTRNYGIPADNPFIAGNGAPEVWAYGLRNPFRASFDFGPLGTGEGALIIGDVGEATVEEIDMLFGPDDGGVNFGWSQREGTLQFKGANSSAFRAPVAQYLHGTGPLAGSSVIGGVVYRGPVESLRGQYLFADFIEGNLWSLPVDAMVATTTTIPADQFTLRNASFAPDIGAINNPVAFGTDQSGNVYIVDLDGEIFAIEGVPIAQPSRPERVTTQRYWCLDAWDGRTVRWMDNQMLLAGQGLACVRKAFDKRAAEDPAFNR